MPLFIERLFCKDGSLTAFAFYLQQQLRSGAASVRAWPILPDGRKQ
jgi:hypothetical protein